jgi:two-component sensor histidine kinase
MNLLILSHKLKNSLQTIQSTAELLEEYLDEECKEKLKCIQKDVYDISEFLKKEPR